MADSNQEQEQNRSEEPTPYKLRRARERGLAARGTDLGFFAGMAVLGGFMIAAGTGVAMQLAMLMRRSFAVGIPSAQEPQRAAALAGATYWSALQPVLLFGIAVFLFVVLLEIVQLRGFLFSTHPLKP